VVMFLILFVFSCLGLRVVGCGIYFCCFLIFVVQLFIYIIYKLFV